MFIQSLFRRSEINSLALEKSLLRLANIARIDSIFNASLLKLR